MFRLAQDLGMTVGELEKRMSSRELTEWMGFYEHCARAQDPTRGMDEQEADFVRKFKVG